MTNRAIYRSICRANMKTQAGAFSRLYMHDGQNLFSTKPPTPAFPGVRQTMEAAERKVFPA